MLSNINKVNKMLLSTVVKLISNPIIQVSISKQPNYPYEQ